MVGRPNCIQPTKAAGTNRLLGCMVVFNGVEWTAHGMCLPLWRIGSTVQGSSREGHCGLRNLLGKQLGAELLDIARRGVELSFKDSPTDFAWFSRVQSWEKFKLV